jgi:hypothetical protein
MAPDFLPALKTIANPKGEDPRSKDMTQTFSSEANTSTVDAENTNLRVGNLGKSAAERRADAPRKHLGSRAYEMMR